MIIFAVLPENGYVWFINLPLPLNLPVKAFDQKTEYPAVGLSLPARYIAVYLIDSDERTAHAGIVRAKYGDLPVVCLMPTGFAISVRNWYDRILWNLDPYEWVTAIQNASVVYTDSYHAALFSMRKRIPFIATYVEELRAPRLLDLKVRYKLGASVQKASSVMLSPNEPDWHAVETCWQGERDLSMRFLKNAFGINPKENHEPTEESTPDGSRIRIP